MARQNVEQEVQIIRRDNPVGLSPSNPVNIIPSPNTNDAIYEHQADIDEIFEIIYGGASYYPNVQACLDQTYHDVRCYRIQYGNPSTPSPTNAGSGTRPTQAVQSSQTPFETYPGKVQETQLSTTPIVSTGANKYPEQNGQTITSIPTPTSYDDPPGDNFSTGQLAAAIMLPMLFILVLGLLAVFFYRRRSRRDRASAGSRAMKVNQDANYAPMTYTTQQGPPLMMTRPPHLHPHPPHPAVTNIPRVPYPRPQSTQPIILGPMSQSNSGNYHTGLDTDVLSISESTIQRNGGFPIEDPDEPPPPYRPRSVVTFVSREASTRSGSLRPDAQVDGSTDHLIHGALAHPGRSPFADPDDDDAVSIISEPERHGGMRQGRDIMSDVSDLSYQNSFRRP